LSIFVLEILYIYQYKERKQQTHQNAIQSEENEDFVCRIHQNATTNDITLANPIPSGFILTSRPFKVVHPPGEGE
jgi:hypothetical protein